LGEVQRASYAQVGKDGVRLDPGVAFKIPDERSVHKACRLQETRRRIFGSYGYIATSVHSGPSRNRQRTVGVWTEVEVTIFAGENGERTSGTELDDWRHGEVAECLRDPVVPADLS